MLAAASLPAPLEASGHPHSRTRLAHAVTCGSPGHPPSAACALSEAVPAQGARADVAHVELAASRADAENEQHQPSQGQHSQVRSGPRHSPVTPVSFCFAPCAGVAINGA
jgi:hypothetical protein